MPAGGHRHATAPAFAQATIHGDLSKDWAGQKTLLVALANAMPEDKYGFKPTPAQRTFGEHVLHIAQVNVMLTKALGGKTPEPAINMKATTKADMIKAMSDSFDYGAKVIAEFNNTTIQETIQARSWGPRLGHASCSSSTGTRRTPTARWWCICA